MNDILRQKIKDLPTNSGVYLMKDKNDDIIYVGKAKNLKNRVTQYFHSSQKSEKTMLMVENICDFRYIITNNEVDALVLENNLIKEYLPKYNILLKDDKSYPFIKINTKEKYPKIEVVRRLVDDGSKYFGPYMIAVNYKDILELIQSAFMVRNCQKDLSKLPKNHRPCLMSQIGRCHAPCVGNISEKDYRKIIDDVIAFLKGNDQHIGDILKEKMYDASSKQDYEGALYYKNQLHTLDKLIKQQITALPKDYNIDVFAVYDNGLYTTVSVLNVRAGKLIGSDNYPVEGIVNDKNIAKKDGVKTSDFDDELNRNHLEQFILQYYESIPDIPNEIVVNATLPSENAVLSILSDRFSKKINIIVPQRGVRKQLVEMAENNAKNYLDTFVTKCLKKYNMTRGAVDKLREELDLDITPCRIECYDISHISGTDAVSSMVVFINGEPKKKMYRRFKMKIDQNNDFENMRQTILRRLQKINNCDDESFSATPDLIVIDGGKGQLSSAVAIRDSLNLFIPMISLAEKEEIVFKENSSQGIFLSRRSSALNLLQRVRDEAHRFAVGYHTLLRQKRMQFSQLKEISGIGDKKTDILFKEFKSIEKIKSLSVDDLKNTKGISLKDAQNIYDFFNNKN